MLRRISGVLFLALEGGIALLFFSFIVYVLFNEATRTEGSLPMGILFLVAVVAGFKVRIIPYLKHDWKMVRDRW